MRFLIATLLLLAIGCDAAAPTARRVRSLPVPPPEQPTCNLPAPLHIRNWRGPLGEGSCVHASLKNHAAWHNDWEFVANWPHSDGEWSTRLLERLEQYGRDVVYTTKADPRFLDWCDANHHGAILWWKPSHCCTFMGWVRGSDGQTYACILDNNNPGRWEYTERTQFIRLWSGYGGFALAFVEPPTIPLPFLSYVIE